MTLMTHDDGINLTIHPRDRLGLIGRSGSGRRILMKMLIRLLDYEGTITANARDIKEINLCTLRRNVFYLSPKTNLFSPQLRFNLDPRNEYTDSIIWKVLKDIGIDQEIGSLNRPIEMNGRNIGFDQRVLLLMARFVLSRSKILIVENIFEKLSRTTEKIFEELIFDKLTDCTIILIESKLNYLMRCNRLVVMDRGRIMDDDTPQNIYAKRNGFVNTIVDQARYVDKKKLQSLQRLSTEFSGGRYHSRPNQVPHVRFDSSSNT